MNLKQQTDGLYLNWRICNIHQRQATLTKTREESPSSSSVSMLPAAQISCHIAAGETDEDWGVVISSK